MWHMKRKWGKSGRMAGDLIFEYWIEYLMIFFVLIGFFFALLLNNALLTYFSAVIGGLFAGKVYHDKRKRDPILAPLLIIVGFVLGFTLGAIGTSRFLVVVLFVGAAVGSNYAHRKGYIQYSAPKLFIR